MYNSYDFIRFHSVYQICFAGEQKREKEKKFISYGSGEVIRSY